MTPLVNPFYNILSSYLETCFGYVIYLSNSSQFSRFGDWFIAPTTILSVFDSLLTPISTIPPVDVPGTSQFKLGISRDRPYTIGNWSEFCLFVHRTRLPRPSWDGRRLLRKVAARSLYIPLSPSFLLHFPSWLGRESNPGPSDQLSSTLSTRLWQLING